MTKVGCQVTTNSTTPWTNQPSIQNFARAQFFKPVPQLTWGWGVFDEPTSTCRVDRSVEQPENHGWSKGKAMTMPKRENISSKSHTGILFVCPLNAGLGTISCLFSASIWPALSCALATSIDGSSCNCSSAAGSSAGHFSCLYFSTYSGKSFLKFGQILLLTGHRH